GAGVLAKALVVPVRTGDANHRDVEGLVPFQLVEGREQLAPSQVSGRPEQDQGIRTLEFSHAPQSALPTPVPTPPNRLIAPVTPRSRRGRGGRGRRSGSRRDRPAPGRIGSRPSSSRGR